LAVDATGVVFFQSGSDRFIYRRALRRVKLSAEQQVRAANAQIGVATANFFPQVGLTALLGQASTPLSAITSGHANIWSVAANLTGPIYQGGALRAQKRQAVAFWEQSKLQYEQAALNAFTDVANALVSRQKYEAIRTQQMRSVDAYQEAGKVSLQHYQAGRASYFEVLDAQLQLNPQQSSLAQTGLNRRVVMVGTALQKGGGQSRGPGRAISRVCDGSRDSDRAGC
jgi:outer membrane protein, multidrug efflux system